MYSELKEKLKSMDDEQILKLINEQSKDYTPEALQIIKDEIIRRGLQSKINETEADIKPVTGHSSNKTAVVLKVIGIIQVAIGAILGLSLLLDSNAVQGVTLFISLFISGFVFIGFSEIIRLLHNINEN